jgi:hypothetical protein
LECRHGTDPVRFHRREFVHPERLYGIRRIGSLPRRRTFVSRFNDAFCAALLSAGAAMQRYSWTNNDLPLFSPTPLPGCKNYGILS